MAEKKMRLKIITPKKIKLDEDVHMVIMRSITGDIGILPGHEPYSVILDYGVLRIQDSNNERSLAVYGGLAVMRDNVLTILTEDAEWPDEINAAHAELNREQAEQRLREKLDDMEIQNDQVLLRRALVQIEVSSSLIASQDKD